MYIYIYVYIYIYMFHFFTENHNGCSKDMSVQIIDHCDPNDKERRESYWIETLETSYPKGLNYK